MIELSPMTLPEALAEIERLKGVVKKNIETGRKIQARAVELRTENDRLSGEVVRLSAENARLTVEAQRRRSDPLADLFGGGLFGGRQ